MQTCPHCGSTIKRHTYTLDGWCLEEDDIKCTNPECGYYYFFSYGFTDEGFLGDIETLPLDETAPVE